MKKNILLTLLALTISHAIELKGTSFYRNLDYDVFYKKNSNQSSTQVTGSIMTRDFKNVGFTVYLTKSIVSFFAYFGLSDTTYETDAGISYKIIEDSHSDMNINISLELSCGTTTSLDTLQTLPVSNKLSIKYDFEKKISNNFGIRLRDTVGVETTFDTETR